MKQLFWLMLLAVPYLSKSQSFNSAQDDKGIAWVDGLTWEQVKEKAKKEKKFIFIDAYATWCGPCKKMDREVYPDENVGKNVNPKFISVKLQMDQTAKDNEDVKKWYPVIKEFSQQYSIEGYPSFLFFNSDGKLVHKALGYRDATGFIELAKDALTDPEARYKKSVEKFKSGQLDFASMPDLINIAWGKKDREIALQVVKIYKEKYLDNLSNEQAFNKEDLDLVARWSPLIGNSKDKFFKFFYTEPDLADSIMKTQETRLSKQAVLAVIRKEEINDKIYKDGKPIVNPKPKWEKYQQSITTKYGKKYADKFFPDDQISFYQMAGDWNNYVKYVNVKIKKFPPKVNGNGFGGGWGDAWMLNSYAWDLFEGCDDKQILSKGLPWVDLAIKLDTTAYNADYYDTKANLLYKLGKTREAIELQEIAVVRSKSNETKVESLNKMKAGLATWPVKNNQ